MKPHEQKLREEHTPYTLVLTSGERVKVRSHDHLDIAPLEDEDGNPLADADRADLFRVWSDGQSYRWVAFNAITAIEARAPKNGGGS